MSEFVLVIPLIVVILGLLFYFGHLVIRAEHTSVMTRYEAWRRAANAPGPHADSSTQHTLLNQTFLGNRASSLSANDPDTDHYFPDDPYERMVDAGYQASDPAGTMADAYLYYPDSSHRHDRGRRVSFSVLHEDTQAMWERINSVWGADAANPENTPLRRRHARIGVDWAYTNDWRASAHQWRDTHGGNRHHLRAVRDSFFTEFDADLDNRDGAGNDEGHGSDFENPTGDTLAGQIRELYLAPPGYAGPTVISP